MLAWATYWTCRPDATIEALERAYAAYLDEGDRAQAAMMAYRLAEQHGMRMSIPMAQGWGAEGGPPRRGGCDLAGARLVALDPGPVLWIMEKDYAGAIQRYDEALAFAERNGDRDLAAMSLHDKGHALVCSATSRPACRSWTSAWRRSSAVNSILPPPATSTAA
ncbi:hypothetical protein BH18ACT17_BH18ACT17_13960 [soil metagenome]